METITRFRSFLILSKCSTVSQIRRGHKSFLRRREMVYPGELTEIPQVKLIWSQYLSLKLEENNFKKFLLDELVNEAQICEPELHSYEKVIILESEVAKLKEENLIRSIESVVGGLLSSLEPFPFDYTGLMKEQHSLSILHIRDIIEQHYLAWKYMVPLENISLIYTRLRFSMFTYRSLGNLHRNLEMLQTVKMKLSVAEKIYFLSQRPLNTKSIRSIFVGVNIQLIPDYWPKMLSHSHQYFLFLISFLKELNFTERQIRNGFSAFHLSFAVILKRVNFILKDPELSKHRHDDNFLWLLHYKPPLLHHYLNAHKATFEELTEMLKFPFHLKKEKTITRKKTILHHVNQFFSVDLKCGETLSRHPKFKLVSEAQILDTLHFLKGRNFTSLEIAESITVVLYPRESVERSLNKISLEAEALEKFGFKNGYLSRNPKFFKCGTKERRKLLQLCLYYIEKPYNFSGEGVWDGTTNEADLTEVDPGHSVAQ